MSLLKNIMCLLKNIKVLSRDTIDDIKWNNVQQVMRVYKYGNMAEERFGVKTLSVLDAEQSLNEILNNPKSFYRYGDGEINIMRGENAGTQDFDPRLADLLKMALDDQTNTAYIGIGYEYFYFNIWGENEFANRFYMSDEGENYRQFYYSHCSSNINYIDTGFTQRYFSLKEEERENWYKKLVLLFKNKDIHVFMGKQAYDNLEYKIYDEAKTVKYWFGPSHNAFSMYDEILKYARELPKDTILCFALGATAKALIYELNKEGYICYDIGHMAKDYDVYRKGVLSNPTNARAFYTDDYKLK